MTTEEKAVLPPPSEAQVEALRVWNQAHCEYRTTLLRAGESPRPYWRAVDRAEALMTETGAWQYLADVAERLERIWAEE